jgi:hypothetical protein
VGRHYVCNFKRAGAVFYASLAVEVWGSLSVEMLSYDAFSAGLLLFWLRGLGPGVRSKLAHRRCSGFSRSGLGGLVWGVRLTSYRNRGLVFFVLSLSNAFLLSSRACPKRNPVCFY